MSNRTFFALALAALGLPMAASANPITCDPGETELRFSIISPFEGNQRGEAAVAFAQRVNEQVEGEYCIKVYEKSELSSDPKVFDAILRGDVHFASPNLQRFGPLSPVFGLFDLPYIFDTPVQAEAFMDQGGLDLLSSEIEDDGFALLSVWSSGMRQFSSNTAFRNTKDTEGLTFRYANTSDINKRFASILGINLVTSPLAKVRENLVSGAFDGQENTYSNMYTMGFTEVQDYIIETNHWYLGYGIITSAELMASFDPRTRKIIEDTIKSVSHENNRFSFEVDRLRRQDVLDDGGTIVSLRPDEVAALKDALRPLIDEFKDDIGADIVDRAIRINAETDPFN